MNGLHDLGGMHGFGPILAEPQDHEPLFHHPWEADVLTSMLATLRLGQWSLDEFRSTIEHQPPLQYLRRTYYEKWLVALEILAVEHGLLADAELAERCAVLAAAPRSSSSWPSTKPLAAAGGSGSDTAHPTPVWEPSFEPPVTPPRFGPGQAVRARNRHPLAHTRQPRYVRGKAGVVVRHVGAEPLPELAATGVCQPEHVYLVRFEAAELWGEGAGNDAVLIELWDSYLEPRS